MISIGVIYQARILRIFHALCHLVDPGDSPKLCDLVCSCLLLMVPLLLAMLSFWIHQRTPGLQVQLLPYSKSTLALFKYYKVNTLRGRQNTVRHPVISPLPQFQYSQYVYSLSSPVVWFCVTSSFLRLYKKELSLTEYFKLKYLPGVNFLCRAYQWENGRNKIQGILNLARISISMLRLLGFGTYPRVCAVPSVYQVQSSTS